MKYSCFDAARGIYHVFEDNARIPVNSDLPVPRFMPAVNEIGVPAIRAGRKLPSDAREVGTSPTAVGIIVQCRGDALGAVEGEETGSTVRYIVGFGAALLGGYLFYRVTNEFIRA